MSKDIVSSNQFGVPSARAPRRGEGPQLAADKARRGKEIVKRRHPFWEEYQLRWRWLHDSWEGGTRYKDGYYGLDRRGMPARNLIRHKREYPDPQEFPNQQFGYGSFTVATAGVGEMAGIGPLPGQLGASPAATAQDDDYEYRRALTPVPEFMREAIETYLGKIYDQDIRREGPPELKAAPGSDEEAWWDDVDGTGRDIDSFMQEDIAPLLLVLGCLDVCLDRPALPADRKLETVRDEIDSGQNRVIASIILPENMVWWKEDYAGNYVECVVREYSGEVQDDDVEGAADNADSAGFPGSRGSRVANYRHWTTETVALYAADGEEIEKPREHGYDFVPIRRLIDLKRHRQPMIGKPRCEAIAEYQFAYYNKDSELTLNDSLQAHPLLCVPEDYLKPDQTMSIGPNYALAMKKFGRNGEGGYQPPMFISPPKDPADSLRKNKQDIIDLKDRNACLNKPAAGVTGTTGGTVSQSGYSKAFDAETLSKKLGAIARVLSRVERQLAEFEMMVRKRSRVLTRQERKSIRVVYPSRFQLKTADELLNQLTLLVQTLMMEAQAVSGQPTPEDQSGGNPPQIATTGSPDAPEPVPVKRVFMPTMIGELVRQLCRAMFQGGSQELFARLDAEAKAFLMLHVLPDIGIEDRDEALGGSGSAEQMAGITQGGESGVTQLGGMPPVIFP